MSTSIHTTVTKKSGSKKRLGQAAGAAVESLETRRLLAAFVVNTLLDQTDAPTSSTVSLRDAITRSNANGSANTITFAPALTAGGPATITLSHLGELVINNTVGQTTITGPGAGLLSISGNNASRVFEISAGATVAMSGLSVTQGSVTTQNFPGGFGGGIFNEGTLTLTSVTLSGNAADGGGGGISNDSTLTVINSTINSDTAGVLGGGIFNNTLATATITGSTLSGNSGGFGGAIYDGGALTVINSTFSGNATPTVGGAIYIHTGTVNIFDSTISGNTVINHGGGGIHNDTGTLNLNNTLIAGNTANVDSDVEGPVNSGVSNLIGDGTGMTGLTNGTNGNLIGTHVLPINPMLGTLADNDGVTKTMELLAGSPAIDAGSNAAIPGGVLTDQRGGGFSRISNSTVDIGAFEYNPMATSLVVNTLVDANDAPGGSVVSLRDAIATANANSMTNIYFAPSLTAAGPATIVLDSALGELTIADSSAATTINGPGAGLLSISGNNAIGVFNVVGGTTATISGLTITDGNDTGVNGGGGISNNGTLTLTDCAVTNNVAMIQGGGIFNDGTLGIVDCTFSGNTATNAHGGAILDQGDSLTISGSTFTDNTAFGYAGAIYTSSTTMSVSDSTFSGNSAMFGGAIVNFGTSNAATITNCTFTGNTASGTGGAIHNTGTLAIANTTISGNSSPGGAGGINGFAGTINDTIVAGNTGVDPDINGSVTSGGYNIIGDGSVVTGITNGSNGNQIGTSGSPINPELGALADNGGLVETMALLPGSPALNTGDPNFASPPTTDARGTGFARVGGGRIDIGAYESQLLHFVVTAPTIAPVGHAAYFSVTALDEFGQTAGGYNGTIHFTSTDGSASLPGDMMLNSDGDNTFAAVFETIGPQTITATDSVNSSITGVSDTFNVLGAPVINTTPNLTNVTLSNSAVTLTDTAVMTSGFNATGTITFTLFNGSTLVDTETDPVNGNGSYSTTTGYTLPTSGSVAGTYQWDVSYSGDNNNTTASDNDNVAEQVTVNPVSPTIGTSQQPVSAVVGASIADKATVSGGYNATGTVTFSLYNNSSGTGSPLFTDTEALAGGVATSAVYTTTAAGTDYWVATYNGDTNNSSISTGVAAEPVSITLSSPAISTTPSATSQTTAGPALKDTAVLSGGFNETGTITFTLFLGSTLVDTEMATVNGDGSYTTPTGYTLPSTGSVAGTYQWDASYSGDSNNSAVSENNSDAEQVVVSAANHAPTDIALSNDSVAENQPVGTTVGTLSTTDQDAGNTFTYTLVSGTGSADNASFAISGDTLVTAAVLNNSAQTSYSVRVRSTDQDGLFTEKTFTVLVPVPVARIAFVSAPANAVAGVAIKPALSVHLLNADGSVNSTDKSKVTLSIVSGPTNGKMKGAKPTAEKKGLVTFGKISFSIAGTYVLQATDGSYAAATTTITVAPAAAKKLVFSDVPATLSAGQAFSVQVSLFDKFGNVESGDDNSITLALGKHTKGTTLSGVLSGNLVSGTEVFSDLSFSTDGIYSLVASGGKLKGKSVGTIKVVG